MKQLKVQLLKPKHLPVGGNLLNAIGLLLNLLLAVLLLVVRLTYKPSVSNQSPNRGASDRAESTPPTGGRAHKQAPQLTNAAAELFATQKSPGAIAVGSAEGNLTLSGKPTSTYWGHTDPGNHVTNKGFCSWNRAAAISVAQANQRCLQSLQRHAAATEKKLIALDIDPKVHYLALVNGTDLWNQSNRAGPEFARNYKKALDQELKGKEALVGARVEAFRNSRLELSASGLFGICNRESYYKSQLVVYIPNSESWRWECIALDQARRVDVVAKAMAQNMGNGQPDLKRVSKKSLPSRPNAPSQLTPNPVPLSF